MGDGHSGCGGGMKVGWWKLFSPPTFHETIYVTETKNFSKVGAKIAS